MPGFNFYGDNAAAYNSREPEVLLCGSAGSGKSLAWLVKIATICDFHPGARCLIVRKTRESLTESILVTWERDVLGPHHPVLTKSPTLRRVRQSYRFPNGSEVVCGGMDKPDKVLSSEWDLCYCPEATDLELVDWETLGGRLRAGVVPFQQLAADCNPTTPHHFLYKRQLAGLCKLYTSQHKDNPRYWDRIKEEWTPEGVRYMARLERMTGARRDRFLLGKWVAAEGVVYEYDARVHLLPTGWIAPREWPRVWGIDWGKTSPTVLGVWAVDPDGRMYATREVYKTRLRPDVLGRHVKEWISTGAEPIPRVIVCDHDTANEGYQENFERESGLSLQLADKADRKKGIEACQSRFDVADDGKPRIFFAPRACEHVPDSFLVDNGKPTCGLEEIVGYVYDPDFLADEPIAENDHFCFIAGTLIDTATGAAPIENIQPGDMALTRDGYREVLEAGMSHTSATVMTLVLDDGTELTGTPEHPVWIDGLGFRRMDELRYNDRVITNTRSNAWISSNCRGQSELFGSGSRVSSTADTHSAKRHRIVTTSVPGTVTTSSAAAQVFTAMCGHSRMGRSRMDTMLTTRMVTHSTTPSTIFSCLRKPNTTPSTRTNRAREVGQDGPQCLMNNGTPCLLPLPLGTAHRQVALGTLNTLASSWQRCRKSIWNASDATANTRSSLTSSRGAVSALTSAEPVQGEIQEWTTKTGHASAAGRCSQLTGTRQWQTVRSNAPVVPEQNAPASDAASRLSAPLVSRASFALRRVRMLIVETTCCPVFSLKIDRCPEYFANGILVKNCDMMRYVCRHVDSTLFGGTTPMTYPPSAQPAFKPSHGKLLGPKRW